MEWAYVVTLLLVICVSCHLLISSKRKPLQKGKLPPGPTPLPLIGNFLQIKSGNTLKSLLKMHEKYGPVFTVYLGTRPVLVLCGHQAVKEALIDKAEEFSGRTTNPTLERVVEGYGVAFSNGERWKQLRRFSITALKRFGMGKTSIEERIQEEAQFLLEEFRKTKGKPLEPTHLLGRAVCNIISSFVFGERFDYENDEFQALMRIIHNFFWEISTTSSQLYDMFPTLLKYFPGPHTRLHHIMSDALRFVAKRVKKNQETLDSDFPRDFIDCFLIQMEKEKDNPLSEFNFKNLEITIFSLFFAGTETVSSTLRYCFLFLIKYPEVQAKVHEEIDRVIGHNRIPNSEDRRQMPYTDAVIHEIQRVSDIAPMGLAHMVTCDTEFRGYFIPKVQ
nr:PREDICTED: cytochrome P450 2G1-like [Anolis carolinensis]|eukprot:XP_008121345.1 PREDICTED: cytochrome P450 2G1-like [Anolis carolinensis]